MTDFLHGVETIDILTGARPVRGVKSAVIGLIGTAPIHHVAAADQKINDSVLVLGDVSAAKYFGPELAGYTLPKALAGIIAEGGGIVIAINVFDPDTHQDVVAAADLDIVDDQIQLANGDIISVTVKVDGGGGSALIEGTDYTIDRVAGLITTLADGALDGDAQANVAYAYGDPTEVVAADIIGDVVDGLRTGMQGFLDSFSKYGFFPKIIAAPAYSTQASVVAAMASVAAQNKCRAIYLADAPVATTVEEAITGRGPGGAINFNIADSRGVLCFPHLSVYDSETDATELRPYSQYLAGIIARTDREKGFWYSPSNKTIRSALGTEIPVTCALNDPDSEANQLNAAGIVTVFNAFGSGLRTWGNRSSAFPGSSLQTNFIQSQRVADQVHESLELAMLDFMDEPITDPIIESVLDTGNGYMRQLIGRGAVPTGSAVTFSSEKNPPEELAAGHVIFDVTFVPNPPMERVTFESRIDVSLLAR
jgi:hypothetical protein